MTDVKNFDNRVKLAVENYKKSSKPLVSLLVEAIEIFNSDCGNAGKISFLVNQLAVFPRLQEAAKAISQELCPVAFEQDANGVYKASVSKVYQNLVKDSKDPKKADKKAKLDETLETYKQRLAIYKERDYNSLLASRSYGEGEVVKTFKPVKIDKLESKIADLATNLLAVALLSNPALTREEAIQKLTSKISGIVESEIEEAKKAILKKTPLAEVKEENQAA